MKKILIGVCVVILAVTGICVIMQAVPPNQLAGWSTPSEGLLVALRSAGPGGFFGMAAGFLVLSLAITAVEKSRFTRKSR
ncbi:MAG: hypothetical protein ACOX7I_07735 [Oscillospiraceae bacterium]|jgi:quinol-cytochrome oxidoreductase complex cytochrome b subunit